MITYHQGRFFLFRSLFRVHGSALHRALMPSLFSSAFLLVLEYTSYYPSSDLEDRWFTHPYPIACLMAAFTFLLTFKCSFSYNRYWEACTAIHQMQSKWLDVGMELAAFHLQSERFSHIRPKAFGQYPHIDHVVRKRERLQQPLTPVKLQKILQEEEEEDYEDAGYESILFENGKQTPQADEDGVDQSSEEYSNDNSNVMNLPCTSTKRTRFTSIFRKRRSRGRRNSSRTTPRKNSLRPKSFLDNQFEHSCSSLPETATLPSINDTRPRGESNSLAAGVFKLSSLSSLNRSEGETDSSGNKRPTITKLKSVPDWTGGMSKKTGPSLFLQEASHLLSLLSAVSFATLRNDIESAESPLNDYIPGCPWPPVDPDEEDAYIHYDFYKISRFRVVLQYLFGHNRTQAQRTVYNACRPFCVLGGVSDAEVAVLQRARGPLAKTALCTMWLQEFISREFLNGALGNVSPPIVSRLYQYTSDGMLGYNQARKVAYVPFPFPHSQLTTFFLVTVTFSLPVLMLTFVPEVIVAFCLNTLTVGVFHGLWLVANELEDPFRNVPNDIPLNNFQAQFNEALVCMFAGYHPESWWDIDERKNMPNNSEGGDLTTDSLTRDSRLNSK